MTRVRFSEEGSGTYRVVGVSFDPGDANDVPDAVAEDLAQRPDFERADSDDHVCEECGESFDSPQALGAHKRSHDGEE